MFLEAADLCFGGGGGVLLRSSGAVGSSIFGSGVSVALTSSRELDELADDASSSLAVPFRLATALCLCSRFRNDAICGGEKLSGEWTVVSEGGEL
jgi:hypothetical protein